jgi:hypothetical protein
MDALEHLLRLEPRGSANRHHQEILGLIKALDEQQPADLSRPGALAQLEGVWELRWSSSRQPYLAVAPWLENLQCLVPSQGRWASTGHRHWRCPVTTERSLAEFSHGERCGV